MSDHEPIAQRARREIDALSELRRDRPILFWLLLCAFGVVAIWFVYDRVYGVPALREQIAEKEQRITLLETQLAPFRTLALDRFPGKEEGEALARLARQIDDLRREFEKSLKSIRSFAAEISIITKGEWTNGKPPDPSRLVRFGGGDPGARVKLLLDGSEERWLDLDDPEDLRVTTLSEGETRLQYRVEARPGTWIIGHHPQECVACREAQVFLWAFNAASTIDKTVVVKSITFRFFANGVPELVCEIKPEQAVALATEGSTQLTWKGNVAVQPP